MTTSLSNTLHNISSSIKANSEAISITSENVANANNEKYQRKEVNLSSTLSGVEVSNITNSVNQILQNKLVKQISTLNFSQTKQLYYDKIESLIGDPNQERSISDYAVKFESALILLSTQPDSTTLQNNFVLAAKDFSQSIQGLFYELQSLRYEADQELQLSSQDINRHINQLKELNILRATYQKGSNEMATLEQKISYKVEDIAAYINVISKKSSEGDTHLSSNNGITILDNQLRQFSYIPAPAIDQMINDYELNPMKISTISNSGKIWGSENVINGGKDGERNSIFTAGKIAALQQLRDVELPEMLERLDALAFQLADSFNKVHNQGTSYQGAEIFTGDKKISISSKFNLSGSVRLGLVDLEGEAIKDGNSFIAPLDIDLKSFDEGEGPGVNIPLSRIIERINQYYTSDKKNYLKASIVDENGNDVEQSSFGYLQIKSANVAEYRVILDDLNSSNDNNNQGLFQTLGMNNLFTAQSEIKNSAYTLSIRQNILDNPQLLSVGRLKRRMENDLSSEYITSSSDNDTLKSMMNLMNSNLDFKTSSGSGSQKVTLEKYLLSFMESTSNSAALAKTKANDDQEVYDSYLSTIRELSGVSIDTELLSLMKYQSAINANAKMVTILNDVMRNLLSMII